MKTEYLKVNQREKTNDLQIKIIKLTAGLSAIYLQKTEGKLMANQESYSGKLLFKSNKLISEKDWESLSLTDPHWKTTKDLKWKQTQRGVGYK